jgi:hypothetical protein
VSGQSWDLAQVNQRENPRGVGFGASRTLGAPERGCWGTPLGTPLCRENAPETALKGVVYPEGLPCRDSLGPLTPQPYSPQRDVLVGGSHGRLSFADDSADYFGLGGGVRKICSHK